MSDDPFADLPGDADRTVIRPRPGGGRTAAPPAVSDTTPDPMPRGLDDQLPLIGLNPLLRAAAPLLAAIQRLRGQAHHPNPDALRRALTEGVREFEQRALQTGMDSRSLRAARYALCATIDDLVLSTPWGSHSAWTTQSLTSLFHNEVSGGERFFDILDQMEREIGKHGDVVEMMFVCLCLGFEGRAIVVIDEAYIEWAETPSLSQWLKRFPHLVILRTLSKAHALAGARLGALLAAPEVIEMAKRVIPPYALTQSTIESALQALQPAELARSKARRDGLLAERETLRRGLEASPLVDKVWPSDANFLLLDCNDAERFMKDSMAGGTIVRDLRAYPALPRSVRVSVGTREQNAALLASVGSR